MSRAMTRLTPLNVRSYILALLHAFFDAGKKIEDSEAINILKNPARHPTETVLRYSCVDSSIKCKHHSIVTQQGAFASWHWKCIHEAEKPRFCSNTYYVQDRHAT